MQCPYCSYQNSPGARFCQNCGKPFPVVCPKCRAQNDPQARFCQNCGTGLITSPAQPSGGAADHLHTRLQQYIPRELLAKLEAARASQSLGAERRVVTILFCDVEGSTALAENLDPEDWAEIMNDAFAFLITPVYKYEGTLARLMGDAILAFFGAPIAHEDDPRRAVLAGLEIAEGIKPYREQVRKERGIKFDVRVGINTGLVVVGEVGSDLRVEYTAMGDAVNLASRIEQRAEPGSVHISGNTYKSVHNLFHFESLGEIEVKGKAEPVAAYRVIAAREGAVPTRGIEGLSSPLVGRDAQMQTLKSNLEELGGGRGQIVSVMGEAGLGKSRLVAELRKALPSNVSWHEGRSLSYETTTPYAPINDLLRSLFGLSVEDSDGEKYRKIVAGVDEVLPGQSNDLAPFLASPIRI